MNVAVLGADSAGRDIASLCARAGHGVSLYAEEATSVMDRIDDIERRIIDAAADGEITLEMKSDVLDELEATTDLGGAVAGADVVFETTITEPGELQAKFAEIESATERETLITTSTITHAVTTAAAGLRQPDRAFGLHFFDRSEPTVVELVVAKQATAEATERAEAFLETIGVTPVRVADVAGIASTRLELVHEVEAMRAVEDEVVTVEGIDSLSTKAYHHPMGPLERADRAGLESRLETLETLAEALGARFEPPAILRELVENGYTGMAAGTGFYRWESGEPVESALETPRIAQQDEQIDDPTQS
ncbi:3-hydroxyacyl-CoA dehydrogenase family protein [Halobacteriaceae archaeon SHR40]|uniref:3-hydroxyacyl-CoA dehydrogenase family protein n=1 Tax=Halovenus amylolytica TaxID=2500550 RepID=UPI000FE2AE7A